MIVSKLFNTAPQQRIRVIANFCNRYNNDFGLQKRKQSSTQSITYSGGHACGTSQGGYYGSGGARAKTASQDISQDQRSKVLALASDVQKISIVMDQIELLENQLKADQDDNGGSVTNKSVEMRAQMKHLVTNQEFQEALDNLEVEGAPSWGLSADEHELIKLAREKVNTC